MITPLMVYDMLARICRSFPAQYEREGGKMLPCRRPNSFAVMDGLSDLDNPNLGKSGPYQEAGYLFFRRYEESGRNIQDFTFDYPVIGVIPQDINMSGFDDHKHDRLMVSFAVLDQNVYPAECNCGPCMNRTAEQQQNDLAIIARRVLEQTRHYMYCRNNSMQYAILTPAQLASLNADGGNWNNLFSMSQLMSDAVEFKYIRSVYNDNVSGLFGRVSFSLNICYGDDAFEDVPTPIYIHTENCTSC